MWVGAATSELRGQDPGSGVTPAERRLHTPPCSPSLLGSSCKEERLLGVISRVVCSGSCVVGDVRSFC